MRPLAQEDHAERALHAALSMQRRLDELFGDALSLRIGVNTGDVVVGQPREGSSFVSGDAVNVAARLEQAAEPGEILVGERTAAAAPAPSSWSEPTRRGEGQGRRRRVPPTRPRAVADAAAGHRRFAAGVRRPEQELDAAARRTPRGRATASRGS